jgi:purine nucleosidase
MQGKVRVEAGADRAMPDERTPISSPGAQLIIDEAMKGDPRVLNVLFLGPLTDMASALLMQPRIEERKVHVIWVGGSEGPTHYGREFNLSNDIHAANVVMRSRLEISTIPYPLYGYFCVSHAELIQRVAPHGAIGKYLVEQLLEYNASTDGREFRSLGDSPAVGVLLAPYAGKFKMVPAPEYDPKTAEMRPSTTNRPIRVYETFDARFLLEDFYAKLARFAQETL